MNTLALNVHMLLRFNSTKCCIDAGNMGQGVLWIAWIKYIEWVELYKFWKKGMILFQIYIDSDNWLTTANLIRSSFNYIAIGILHQIT